MKNVHAVMGVTFGAAGSSSYGSLLLVFRLCFSDLSRLTRFADITVSSLLFRQKKSMGQSIPALKPTAMMTQEKGAPRSLDVFKPTVVEICSFRLCLLGRLKSAHSSRLSLNEESVRSVGLALAIDCKIELSLESIDPLGFLYNSIPAVARDGMG